MIYIVHYYLICVINNKIIKSKYNIYLTSITNDFWYSIDWALIAIAAKNCHTQTSSWSDPFSGNKETKLFLKRLNKWSYNSDLYIE